MEQLIRRLELIPETSVESGPNQWLVRVAKPNGVQLEIVVPRDVLEWFVTARDADGSEFWSDWMDYTGYVPAAEERTDQLASRMSEDVESFVRALVTAESFRITEHRLVGVITRKQAEWQIRGEWRRVALAQG